MFPDATANARKYILLVTNTQDVLIFDLEDKIREDLLNLNVTQPIRHETKSDNHHHRAQCWS